ncbi:MAG: hypothetical protein AB7O52_16640 [Planctomycetota bacterium]
MQKRKVLLTLLAFVGVYFVAAGGIMPAVYSPNGLFGVFLKPLRDGSPFDVALLMVAVILLVWGFLIGDHGPRVERKHVLAGVGVGSALLLTLCLIGAVTRYDGAHGMQLVGTLTLVAVAQGLVGFLAGFLLFCRRDSRKLSYLPLAMNGSLTAIAALLAFGSFLN